MGRSAGLHQSRQRRGRRVVRHEPRRQPTTRAHPLPHHREHILLIRNPGTEESRKGISEIKGKGARAATEFQSRSINLWDTNSRLFAVDALTSVPWSSSSIRGRARAIKQSTASILSKRRRSGNRNTSFSVPKMPWKSVSLSSEKSATITGLRLSPIAEVQFGLLV